MKRKIYRKDHDKVRVYCPSCRLPITGWTYQSGWGNRYWINHSTPIHGKECWTTEEQMKQVRVLWEEKYEYVEGPTNVQ